MIDAQPTAATVALTTTLPPTGEKGKEKEVLEKDKGSEGKSGHHVSSRWSSAPSGRVGSPTKRQGPIGWKEERRQQLALLSREEEENGTEELYTVTILVPNEAMGLLIGRCKERGGG